MATRSNDPGLFATVSELLIWATAVFAFLPVVERLGLPVMNPFILLLFAFVIAMALYQAFKLAELFGIVSLPYV